MRGKALVGAVIVAVVAFGVGWFLHQPSVPGKLMGGHVPTTYKVVDVIDANNSCKQLNSASGGFAKLPQLWPGDSITWVKGIAPGGGSAPLVITFPTTSNGHVGTPFVDSSGNPKYVFNDGDNSGPVPPGVPSDVYLYQSMTIGGVACTNPQDPGVIVDR
jgi:hypothetical protein